MHPLSADFDWVEARARCSAPPRFEELRRLAKANTEQRNAHHDSHDPEQQFQFRDRNTDATRPGFAVFDTSRSTLRAVYFSLQGDRFRVHQELTLGIVRKLEARLILNDNGECVFKMLHDQRERYPWQLLRLALEPLFYVSTDHESQLVARVFKARTARDGALPQRLWALRKNGHEAAIDLRPVPGIGAEIVLTVDGETATLVTIPFP
jgi:hypothetical protein